MKKFILSMLLLCVAAININAQDNVRLSGNVGATVAIEPHNSYLTSYPMTFNGGVGALFNSGLYMGVGMSLGCHYEEYHDHGYSETNTAFIMPFYAQVSYLRPQHWYGDVQIGGEYVSVDGEHGTFFYCSVTPLGYTFDTHSSIGIGWRYHAKNEFEGHSIAVKYQYTF